METNGNSGKSKLKRMLEVRSRFDDLALNILKVDPRVSITLRREGTDVGYFLEYSLGAVIEIFKSTGINLNTTQITPDQIANPGVFGSLLLEGLRTCQPTVFAAYDDVSVLKLASMRHMTYYTVCISKALEAIQPDQLEMAEIMEEMKEAQESDPLPLMSTSSSSGPDVDILDAPILKR